MKHWSNFFLQNQRKHFLEKEKVGSMIFVILDTWTLFAMKQQFVYFGKKYPLFTLDTKTNYYKFYLYKYINT